MEAPITTYQKLRRAILQKQQVFAEYQGFYRKLCPHALGMKNGKARCIAYQFGGESSKGTVLPDGEDNWRCLFVEELTILEVKPGHFYSGGDHSRRQSCIDLIDVEIAGPNFKGA